MDEDVVRPVADCYLVENQFLCSPWFFDIVGWMTGSAYDP